MQNITIKEFIPEDSANDKENLLPAYLEIWNDGENLRYLSLTLKPFAPEVVSFWFENHKEMGGRYFCALNGKNEILGIAIVKISPIEGFELLGIGVRPDCKRQGVGRALIERTIGLAVEIGFRAVDVTVFADNSPMLIALISMGFIPVGMDYHKRADGANSVSFKKYL